MRNPTTIAGLAGVAALALALAACGGEPAATDNAANELDANMTLDAPANDASAMEAVGNVAEEAPAANETNAVDGEDDGGDTGGNNVESNTVGM